MFVIKPAASLGQLEFEYFRAALYAYAGISLSDAKVILVETRLRPRLDALGLSGFAGYRNFLETLPDGHEEWQTMVNLLTTNKTEFFREPGHFDYLEKSFLPSWQQRAQGRTLQVWSAACSTGEEPYTLAMVLDRHFAGQRSSYHIVATDIDTDVLAQARNGVYPVTKLSEVPADHHQTGFLLGTGEISDWMRIKPHLQEHVGFERGNLTNPAQLTPRRFDLIFCRNVLIYFDQETVAQVARNLYAAAQVGATLVISHAESLQNRPTPWTYVQPSIYRKDG